LAGRHDAPGLPAGRQASERQFPLENEHLKVSFRRRRKRDGG